MRREFLKKMVAVAAAAATAGAAREAHAAHPHPTPIVPGGRKFRLSLNAFSFNDPLLAGTMNLDDLLEFSATTGFDAVDITAYYFPGYPQVPTDEYLHHVKHKAFRLGLDISGTGVRNDFTDPDKNKRAEHVVMVKKWIESAEKIGAPVIRIFAGNQHPQGYTRDQVIEWMMEDISQCLEHGKKHGVMVAIQNHNDFIQTADDAIKIIQKVNSDWFGLILDTGSYRVHDPYEEIAKSIPYAVNWQIKENVFIQGAEKETDLKKLLDIIKASSYRGYLPIETLGPGDAKTKVTQLFDKINKVLA